MPALAGPGPDWCWAIAQHGVAQIASDFDLDCVNDAPDLALKVLTASLKDHLTSGRSGRLNIAYPVKEVS